MFISGKRYRHRLRDIYIIKKYTDWRQILITNGAEIKMDINIKQVQQHNLSTQMLQSMGILQMSATELEAYIENLSMENPLVDIVSESQHDGDSSQEAIQRKLEWLESTDYQNRVYYRSDNADQDYSVDIGSKNDYGEELSEYLLSQLLLSGFSDDELEIIKYMLESLDSRGYFTEPIADVASHFSCSEERILWLLEEIQKLDPAGVGARDLKECLLLQLKRLEKDDDITAAIIENHLEDIAKNHQRIISRKLNVDIEKVNEACETIRALNPKPGGSFNNREQLRYITPDAVVVKLEDRFEILVNEYQYPHFNLNSYYQELYTQTEDKETKKYLHDKIQQAEWVQSCIANRTSTLSRVVHALVEFQEKFFIYGHGHKVPMQLADIADALELSESTISRCMSGKYLQCSYGIFPLNFFLTSVACKSNITQKETTTDTAKERIRLIVDSENKQKPYSDQAISDKLKEYDIHISRRTVNKYRTEMGIPDKPGRKK